MQAIIEFLSMDGYACYVWSAYGISLVVLLLGILIPLRREKTLLDRLGRSQRQER